MNELSYDVFLDKVHGCWYGKCLGGAAGAPVEGVKKIINVSDFTEIFRPDLPNDDLDLQVLWLDTLEEKGTVLTACDLADAWVKKCWYPFSEYGYFLKNYMRGVKPPYSGIINNSFFTEGMGCLIRSEIWGIISVGNPGLAAQYAYMDGSLDHSGNAVWAEQFFAVIESMAFFESDIRKLITLGLSYIPADSRLAACIQSVMTAHQNGISWKAARKMILDIFGHPDFTNVLQNTGFIIIALLYGMGDMRESINLALRCGYDADCTCATVASILGIISGYRGLGELTSLINDYYVLGVDVVRPSDSIRQLAEDSCRAALAAPNFDIQITDAPFSVERPKDFHGLELDYPSADGLQQALHSLPPRRWEIYGPFYEQLEQPMDPRFPCPHGEGCNLPDMVCMVNNQVFLDKAYITEFGEPDYVLDAYEDWIDIDSCITMQGQMCCYARTVLEVKEDMKAWIVVGNNDGFRIWLNGQEILAKDEIRYWTPYNNFTLMELKKGKNLLTVKLLKRTEQLKFTAGFRIYDGGHWHRSKWHIDL